MKQGKLCSLGMLLLMLVTLATSCAGQAASGNARVRISGEKTHLETSVDLTQISGTADKIFIQACQNESLSYTFTNGMFDNFGGEASTQTDGWLFYYNGVLSEKGAQEIHVQEEDLLEFRYVNYDKAFQK